MNERKTGNSLKSMSASFSGLTTSAKDGSIQLTKAGKSLKEIAGIEVWDEQTGQVKDMFEVVDELSEKWDDLSEAERTALGTSVAGKTQLNAFNALISNWETAKQYVDEYNQGLTVGSAEKENLKYLDSINGKWNTIKTNMQDIGNTLISSDLVKGFLDGLVVITDGLNSFTKGVTNTFSSLAKGTLGSDISNSIYELFESLGINSKFTTSLSSGIGGVFQGLFDGLKETALSNTFFGQLKNMSKMFQTFSKMFSEDSFIGKLGGKLAELEEAINYKFLGGKRELDNSIEERTANVNAIDSEIKALEGQKKSIEDVMETYDKLSSKNKRTKKENEQLAEITNQLAETNPDLVLGYKEDGTPILKNLQLQNKELESQIKLKQQSQRLEENNLANEVLERRTKEQKDYNKALEEYNNTSVASNTKRKEGLFGEESLQEYAQRVIDNNEKIAEENEKAYQQRLEDHQQYIADEQAIQERYINQMENNTSFGKMTDDMKSSMLTFMDALDWTNFSVSGGTQFTNQLAKLDEEIVSATSDMGEHSKAITQLTSDYADGEINLSEFTKGLTEQYEAAGKFDVESFTAWRQGLQSYVDTTGDLESANKEIEKMAKSLEKVTGIDMSTWKTALSFDPAPIDASNKALERFLNTYNTSFENRGQEETDKLISQYETLQDTYTQLTNDLANGKEIDVEYLLNARINQPKPIQELIDEIVADGEVTEEEIELLLRVMPEILNGGEITDETITQIAKLLGMTEEEVRVRLNVKTEVEEVEETKSLWDNIVDKTVKLTTDVIGKENLEKIKEMWDGFTKKVVDLTTKIIGKENLEKLKEAWDVFTDKWVELTTKVKEEALKKAKELWDAIKTKTEELTTKIKESKALEKAKELWDTIVSKTEELTTKVKESKTLEKAKELWDAFKEKVVGLTAEVKAKALEEFKEHWDLFIDKTVNLICSILNGTLIEGFKEKWDAIQSKIAEITASVVNFSLVDSLKGVWEAIKSKFETLTAQVVGSELVSTLKGMWDGIKTKAETLTAKVVGSELVSTLKGMWDGIKTKTVELTAKVKKVGSAVGGWLSNLFGSSIDMPINATPRIVSSSPAISIGSSNPSTVLSNTPLANIPISASASSSTSPLANIPVTAKASSDNVLDISKILPSLDFDISHIKNLEEALERLGGQLDLLNEKSEAVFGQEKVSLLKQQIPLLREQQKIQEQIAINERNQNNELIYWLNNKGFSFDAMGNISNYNDKLLEMEKNVESLKKKSEASSDNKSLKEQYDAANEALEKTKDYLEEYFTTNNTEITEASKKWWEYENSIRETEQAIRDVINAQLENKIEAVVDQIDFLDAKIDNLSEQDKVTYLKQQNELYKEQQDLSHQLAEQMRSQLATLDENSDEYVELQHEIIQLSTEWWELENAIADVNEVLEEIRRNKAIEPLRNSLEEINYLLDRHSDRLDLIDAQYENTTGAEKVEYLTKKQQILNEQLLAQEEAHKKIYNLAKGMQGSLWQFGFKVDENSLISNYDEVLNSLVGTSQYELAKQYADEYMEVVREDLIDIQVETYETQNAIKDLAQEIQDAMEEARQSRLEPFKNSLEEIRYELDRCTDRIDLLDESNTRSQGQTQIDYLYDKIDLLNEQLEISQGEFDKLYNLAESMQKDLWQHGFKLDANGLISNYDEILNSLVGSAEYENAKNAADEYMELMRNDYIENKLEIKETQNAIKELTDEIETAEKELRLFSSKNKLTNLNNEFNELSIKLDLISNKLEYAFGTNKLELMKSQIEVLNNQLDLQAQKLETVNEQSRVYQDILGGYGFVFDSDGSITNFQEVMDAYRDTEAIEKLTDLTEEYFDIHDELNDITVGYHNLSNEIKDVYKEQLETTQNIEQEITKVIEEEYEKRKDEVEKFTNEKIDLLNKEKEAYQELRDEQDYKDSVDDQIEEIERLNRLIETAKRDTSISGQQRLKELMEELTDAQEELQEITQDKIDSDFEKNIDKEIEKLEKEEEDILASLEEKFSEVNIASMVKQALTDGFLELNGQVTSIQDILINSINESAEGYSVMAGIVKDELIANLNIALSTMNEISSIYSNLNVGSFDVVKGVNTSNIPVYNKRDSNTSNVNFTGDTIFNINGNPDNATLAEIEEMIKQSQDKMLDKITQNLN